MRGRRSCSFPEGVHLLEGVHMEEGVQREESVHPNKCTFPTKKHSLRIAAFGRRSCSSPLSTLPSPTPHTHNPCCNQTQLVA